MISSLPGGVLMDCRFSIADCRLGEAGGGVLRCWGVWVLGVGYWVLGIGEPGVAVLRCYGVGL